MNNFPFYVKNILKYKSKGKLLDLGGGSGRNSILLSKQGFDVTYLDKSKEDATNLKNHLKEELSIDILIGKIEEFDWEERYDVILSSFVLHFLNERVAKDLLQRIKENTNTGGINSITVFNTDNPNKDFCYLFEKNELKNLYGDWKILNYREYVSNLETHGGKLKPHRHGISELISQKP